VRVPFNFQHFNQQIYSQLYQIMSKHCSLALWLLIILISCDLYRACSSSQTVGNVGEAIIYNLAFGMKETVKKIQTCGLPRILSLTSKRIMSGDEDNILRNIRLSCTVDMQCMVSYIKWYKLMDNGTNMLLRSGVIKNHPYILELENVSAVDSGQYNCVAGNVLGETSASYNLQINSADKSHSVLTQISFILFNLLWRRIG